jgi:hypothetical protein
VRRTSRMMVRAAMVAEHPHFGIWSLHSGY